jgi:hypothetical protein
MWATSAGTVECWYRSTDRERRVTDFAITVTTWDNGRGHSEAMCDGPVRDHLLSLGEQALGLFPDLDVVVFRSKSHHSEITIYRKETNNND